MAEPLHYGFGKGCDFAKKSCKEYIQLRKNAGQSMSPYCDFEGYYHIERLSCLPDYKASAFCDLYKHQSVIDAIFQV
ncbi:hypothetical protein NP493_361g00000 [Ridgeia piscesae]|uniref:Uncharacterized protein n=1 Tax=Ridgeia piscesae TaxID=27915 RepID=A0AAD9NTH5_RIDPI|nr:hypothetical protein NP493_361g00000 [Ridgeia piscesae]